MEEGIFFFFLKDEPFAKYISGRPHLRTPIGQPHRSFLPSSSATTRVNRSFSNERPIKTNGHAKRERKWTKEMDRQTGDKELVDIHTLIIHTLARPLLFYILESQEDNLLPLMQQTTVNRKGGSFVLTL